MTQAVLELASQLQDKLKTLTVDHGKEFANHQAIEQLKARGKDQSAMIDLLKQQLSVKDEQIASANRLADQAQRLDLTTHKQTNPKEIDV
jgi:Protein of unknown function, DUF536.